MTEINLIYLIPRISDDDLYSADVPIDKILISTFGEEVTRIEELVNTIKNIEYVIVKNQTTS